jgi:hypothetical protein
MTTHRSRALIAQLREIAERVDDTQDYEEGLREAVDCLLQAIADPKVTTAFHEIPKRTPWYKHHG